MNTKWQPKQSHVIATKNKMHTVDSHNMATSYAQSIQYHTHQYIATYTTQSTTL